MEHPFLGRGWHFPPEFAADGAEVAMVSGVEDVHQSLQILFSTGLGERAMQEHFGCDLQHVQFAEIDQSLLNSLRRIMTDAILYHESRIRLDDLAISEGVNQPGLLLISLDYTVRSSNSRFNMVYPFYINEASTPVSV
jgi:uncharacterized protein